MNKLEIQNIAVLMSCHNRKQKTLDCLRALSAAEVPAASKFQVFLVDDGSTDGTGSSVQSEFPDVTLIPGNGQLYWNRGMILAWETATQHSPDFYLLLNDDTILAAHVFTELLETSAHQGDEAIVVGTTCAVQDSSIVTYGGRNPTGGLIVPNGDLQKCHHFNGNCVLVPDSVYRKLGTLDPYYRHSFGDFDYGLRATKVGVKQLVSPTVIGICDTHVSLPKWCNSKTSLRNRLHAFYSPLGCSPFEVFHLDLVRSNIFIGIFHLFTTHLRVLFPRLWSRDR